jgi:hypothetical protein
MVNYLKNMIKVFPEHIIGREATPAGERLFDIKDEKEAKPLDEECEIAFHHTTK